MRIETSTTTALRVRVVETLIKQEGDTKLVVILSLLLAVVSEAESEAVVTKFQDAYDALFEALGGRPNGQGAADGQG